MNLDREKEISKSELMSKKENQNLIESIKNYIENLEKRENVKMIDTASVDRIENNIAVCELLNGKIVNISTEKIPFSIKEGDVLKLDITYKNGKIVEIEVKEKDEQEKRIREEWIKNKIKEIKK